MRMRVVALLVGKLMMSSSQDEVGGIMAAMIV
jgi:hypothetical protein